MNFLNTPISNLQLEQYYSGKLNFLINLIIFSFFPLTITGIIIHVRKPHITVRKNCPWEPTPKKEMYNRKQEM